MASESEAQTKEERPSTEAAVVDRLRAWAHQQEDQNLKFAAERALPLVDAQRRTLRAAVPADLGLRLANDGREFTLHRFRDGGTVDALADAVIGDGLKLAASGLPLNAIPVLDRLTDTVITMMRSVARRIRDRELDPQIGFTRGRQALLAETAEAIAAQLTAMRTEILASASRGGAISATAVESAATALEEHFAKLRDAESKRSTTLLLASGGILAFATALGVMSVIWPSIFSATGPTWYTALHLSTIMLPIYGLAGFLVRESTRHRSVAIWATRLSAQLQSIGPFVGSFVGSYPAGQANDTRDLWMAFGKDNVFAPDRTSGITSDSTQSDSNQTLKYVAEIIGTTAKQASS